MYNNYNNPYYNPIYKPYEQQLPQNSINVPQMQQNVQNTIKMGLQGEIVDSIEVVKASKIPMDYSISYFPISDGSAIVSKQLQQDGTSKIIIFKPSNEQKDDIKYITSKDLEKALESLNFDELEEIKEEIKEMKKQIKKKSD